MNSETLESVKKIIAENLNVTMSLDCTGITPKTRRCLQHMSMLRPSAPEMRSAYELVMQHAFQAEARCPTAGHAFLKRFTGHEEITLEVPKSKCELLQLMTAATTSHKVKQILSCIIEFASVGTKVTIKKSSSPKSHVELSDGYSFSIAALTKTKPLQLKQTKVVCIDGYVESVSEIHHLLTSLSEKKVPCLLLSRGMSDEVLHTIKVNLDRQTVHVYPYLVPFDVENVNTMVDIAIAAGCDVISNTKGELISSVGFDRLGHVDSCVLTQHSVRMRSSSSRRRVAQHVNHLKEHMMERPDIEEILSKRIRSLTSSCIDVAIPDDIDFYSTSQQLDVGIRIMTAVFNNSFHPTKIIDDVMKSLNETLSATVRLL